MAKMGSVRENPKDTRGALLRMLKYLGTYKFLLALIILLSIGGNVLALLGPDFAGKAINEAAAGAGKVNFERVYYYAKRMLLCYLLSSAVTFSISIIMMYVSKWIAGKMRKDVFDKLMKLPVGYFDGNQAGDIISRVSYDIDVVGTCLATDVVQIINSIVTVTGSFVMMVIISPLLSVIALITVPLAIFYTSRMRRITQPRFSKRS
ncbi:MAG: ABC transporter ATP-binding protein, partial [Lachnospiraceae bacterium]|nr:ABC transporter ATP-binding protein [Candidatus Hippenecus merdae]